MFILASKSIFVLIAPTPSFSFFFTHFSSQFLMYREFLRMTAQDYLNGKLAAANGPLADDWKNLKELWEKK